MPTEGKGFYGTEVVAVVTDAAGAGRLVGGFGKATVDFGAGRLDSTWSLDTSTAADREARINFKAEGVAINGTTFAGRATSEQDHSGTIEGGFYGAPGTRSEAAAELAGRFDLEGTTGTVTGAFAGMGY